VFLAQFSRKRNSQFLTVKVAREIEQVDFDLELSGGVLQGGAEANINDRPMLPASDKRVRGVNTAGRNDQAGKLKIRRRKSELSPQLVPADDPSGKRVGAAEHLARGVEVAVADGFANSRAADHLPVQRH